jgi:hypothetical protein
MVLSLTCPYIARTDSSLDKETSSCAYQDEVNSPKADQGLRSWLHISAYPILLSLVSGAESAVDGARGDAR